MSICNACDFLQGHALCLLLGGGPTSTSSAISVLRAWLRIILAEAFIYVCVGILVWEYLNVLSLPGIKIRAGLKGVQKPSQLLFGKNAIKHAGYGCCPPEFGSFNLLSTGKHDEFRSSFEF